MFRKKLFGYQSSEVDSYISRMESRISEQKHRIEELELQIQRLEYDQDSLNGQIAVLKEINQSLAKKINQ